MTTTNLGAADGLAAARAGLFRRAMPTSASLDPAAKLERAKRRLYVLCQAGGWSFFLVMQLVFVTLFRKETAKTDAWSTYFAVIQTICLGLLITHFARIWIARWGWKDLAWRKLALRIPVLAAWLSLIWCTLGYAIVYLVLQEPWTSKFSPFLIFATSFFNGVCLMAGWLCLYFFYQVFDRLNRMQLEQLQLAATAKEAELRALKSQINPHFLFNSLNSLRALIDEDPPRAREAVTRMANMLRYSLQSGQLGTVAFEDELRIVQDYLALEQIRHENRLAVRWEVAADPDTRALPVPPMLLQTLVENAVKYGIGARREGGEIAISARRANGLLRIRVTNPGAFSAANGDSTGVGLRNASERLKLLFGARASLSLRPEPAGSVTAEVCIPLDADPA